MTKDMDIDLEIEADEVAYIYLGTDKHNNLKNLDLPDSHPIRAITGLQEVVDKVSRTEDGAEVNEIVGVKVNGIILDIAEDRTVDVPVPTSYGYYLDLDGNNGVISLKDRDGVVLSTIDTNLERIVKNGRYDADTNELVLVLDDNTEIRIDASKLVDVYTADEDTIVENGHVFALSKGSKDALKDSADHIADRSNPHAVTKAQVGLGNVDNTSDMNKPISTLVQQALDGKSDDSAVVHKSGDTMTNSLLIKKASEGYPLKVEYTTYNTGLLIKRTSVPIDAEITGSINGAKLFFQDAGDVNYAGITTQKELAYNVITLTGYRGGNRSIGLYNYDDGTSYATAPTWKAGTADNSDKILTTKMANSLPSLVHTTGNEEIAGQKTFNNMVSLKSTLPLQIINTSMPLAEGASYTARAINVVDSDNKEVCGLVQEGTQTQNTFSLVVYRGDSSSKFIVGVNDTLGAFASAPSWSVGTADNSDKILTTKMANSLPSLVHTTGNEEIAGQKTFNNMVSLKSTAPIQIINTSMPLAEGASHTARAITVVDSDNKEVCRLVQEGTQTQNTFSLVVYRGDSSSKFIVGVNDTLGAFASAPSWSVGTADNSDKILTTKMANSLPSLVHTTGKETIAGEKVFSSNITVEKNNIPVIVLRNTGSSIDNPSSSQSDTGYTFEDANGYQVGSMFTRLDTDGSVYLNLQTKSNKSGSEKKSIISIYNGADGTVYATAPATNDAQPDNAIVTKKYLLDKIAALEARISALEGSR